MRSRLSVQAAAALLALTLAEPAAAEGLSVTRAAGGGYDVDVPGPASAADLLQAIAGATGADVTGAPQATDVAPARMRGASLQRLVSVLLPRSAFAIRYAPDGTPAAIIFLPPPGQPATP